MNQDPIDYTTFKTGWQIIRLGWRAFTVTRATPKAIATAEPRWLRPALF